MAAKYQTRENIKRTLSLDTIKKDDKQVQEEHVHLINQVMDQIEQQMQETNDSTLQVKLAHDLSGIKILQENIELHREDVKYENFDLIEMIKKLSEL